MHEDVPTKPSALVHFSTRYSDTESAGIRGCTGVGLRGRSVRWVLIQGQAAAGSLVSFCSRGMRGKAEGCKSASPGAK